MFTLIAVVAASFSAFCFVSYLVLLAYVIQATGSTEGLRDVAVAIRAFKFRSAPRIRLAKKRGR